MLRSLRSASVILHKKGGKICYKHCVLRLVISYTRQDVRFVTGIGFCLATVQREAMLCEFLNGLRKPAEGTHHQHQQSAAEGARPCSRLLPALPTNVAAAPSLRRAVACKLCFSKRRDGQCRRPHSCAILG